MYRKFTAPLLAVFCFLLVVTSLYLGRERLTWKSNYAPITHEEVQNDELLTSSASSVIATATRAKTEQDSSSSALPSPTSASLPTPSITNGKNTTLIPLVNQCANDIQELYYQLSAFRLISQPSSTHHQQPSHV